MNNSYLIAFILFGSILGCGTIIVLILAFFQQQKIKHFKQKKHELQKMIDDNQPLLTDPLNEVQIKYELPKDETCYYQATISGYEITKKKEKKQNAYYLSQQMQNKYYVENLAGYLNLTTNRSRETMAGTLYVTNQHLVLWQTKDQNVIIRLKDINFALPSVFNWNGFYQLGFFISTSEKIYCFITNDVKISIIIFKAWQEKGG
ncbi:hypothetical protein [Spiroplasma endosymbiont of Polydrusus formosus]|uniref:hypothetical protein n=1 Tax=Spiroplasma endosymbiont of Polydrusus formosus TaxID=3139326 RepID=UPI0035B55C1C